MYCDMLVLWYVSSMYLYVLVCMSKFLQVLQPEFNADILVQCHTVFPTTVNAKIIVHIRTFSFYIFSPNDGQRAHGPTKKCASSPSVTHLVTFAHRKARIHLAVHAVWNGASIAGCYQRHAPHQGSWTLAQSRPLKEVYGTGPPLLCFTLAIVPECVHHIAVTLGFLALLSLSLVGHCPSFQVACQWPWPGSWFAQSPLDCPLTFELMSKICNPDSKCLTMTHINLKCHLLESSSSSSSLRHCCCEASGLDDGASTTVNCSWQSPFLAARHTSCGICELLAPKCFYRRHFRELALEDFAAEWKVWLSQNTDEMSGNEQEDVVNSAAIEVYCLRGAEAPDTQLDQHLLAQCKYWKQCCAYSYVLVLVLDCIGLYWDHIVECIGVSIGKYWKIGMFLVCIGTYRYFIRTKYQYNTANTCQYMYWHVLQYIPIHFRCIWHLLWYVLWHVFSLYLSIL